MKSQRGLRRSATFGVIVLAIQFLSGMYTNLFVSMTPRGSGAPTLDPANTFANTVYVVHVVLGILVVLAACGFAVQALLSRSRRWTAFTVAPALATLLAAFGGAKFSATGNDAYSFLMAVSFLIALLAYVWPLTQREQEPASWTPFESRSRHPGLH